MGYIELSKENYFHNLDLIAARVGKDKIAIVLKDNAYGHGLDEMAALAAEYGIRRAVVRTRGEALLIAPLFASVLVLADISAAGVASNVHVAVNSLTDLGMLAGGSAIHLKVDTGMHRNGVAMEEVDEALAMIKERGLLLRGYFSHLRGSDELSSTMFWQVKNFEHVRRQIDQWCDDEGGERPMSHLYNSSGVFRLAESHAYDMVRVGIAAYGYVGLHAAHDYPDLRPVLSLWGEKIASRRLKRGEMIGYNGAFRAEKEMTVSTYDIGYGDGLFRLDGSRRVVLPAGKAILGKVSMDTLCVEEEARKVCIFDDARVFASACGTIDYEITTKLSPSLPRRIV